MMNHVVPTKRNFASSALAGACIILGLSSASAAPPSSVEGTYATVTIGDFKGMLDRAGALSNKVKPGLSGELIRGQLGMMLGDEGLNSLAADSGLVVTVPQSGRPFLLLETADGKAQAIVDLLKQKGLMAETVSDKLVAAATDEASLNNAKGAMGQAAAGKLEGNEDKFLMVTLDADKLIEDKSTQIDEFLKNLQQRAAESGDASSTGPAKMFSFLGGMVKAVGKRTDVATLKIDISGDGVQFEKSLYPKGGLQLAEPTGPTGQELTKALPVSGEASIRQEYHMDTQSMMQGMMPIFNEAADAAGVQGATKQELGELVKLATAGFGDGMAGWATFEGDTPKGAYLVSVQDQEKALQYLEEGVKSVQSGAAKDFYSALGLETSATLTRNAATVDGQPAHRISMKMEGPGVEANPIMKMYNMENGMVTFVENKMLLVTDGSSLEEALKAVKSGSANSSDLKSRSELPEGGEMYIDYNLSFMGELMKKENPEMGSAFEGLGDTPILEAAYADNESVRLVMQLPDELITKAAEGIQGMVQKMQQQQQDTPETESEGTEVDTGMTTGTE